ncbi:mitotic checkpoint regulator, MAD2B-interacting-domain-containing protein [Dichotomopilus funicola]|uniref:Mitotic checkpoint regulator, MAD2B-interacting-domain-containing protein n=1 Tax=Dichotomopilus funicola TaxID=1934379 RepID=A0AAN6UWH9_9PEZI|nr:mitotic checkpoint regulator, MAD2B-interacting-domain-containing protein [Dichotomopilus funicola]
MGLVDYSDSESETESVPQKPTPAAAASSASNLTSKKPFQKLLNRSSGAGKIVISLSTAADAPDSNAEDEQPPAKRVKTAGGSRFSSLGSFLPPPKKTAAIASAAAESRWGTVPAPGVHLRTGAEPAFVRGGNEENATSGFGDEGTASASGLNLPAPSSNARDGPSIPEGQKPAEEVKLVGKPLMFKPLSVARKKAPAKNKKKDGHPAAPRPSPGAAAPQNGVSTVATAEASAEVPSAASPAPKKKISLFSMGEDEPVATTTTEQSTSAYEPLFTTSEHPEGDESDVTSAYPSYEPQQPTDHYPPQHQQEPPQDDPHSLASLTSNLSRAARRELFGREPTSGTSSANSSSFLPPNAKVISFNMEREYAHNEAFRTSDAAQAQAHNPVRSIAPGKHSLRQVVNMAQSNREALEESFARAKNNQRDAAGRYGW